MAPPSSSLAPRESIDHVPCENFIHRRFLGGSRRYKARPPGRVPSPPWRVTVRRRLRAITPVPLCAVAVVACGGLRRAARSKMARGRPGRFGAAPGSLRGIFALTRPSATVRRNGCGGTMPTISYTSASLYRPTDIVGWAREAAPSGTLTPERAVSRIWGLLRGSRSAGECPLLGVKQTLWLASPMSVISQKRTFAIVGGEAFSSRPCSFIYLYIGEKRLKQSVPRLGS